MARANRRVGDHRGQFGLTANGKSRFVILQIKRVAIAAGTLRDDDAIRARRFNLRRNQQGMMGNLRRIERIQRVAIVERPAIFVTVTLGELVAFAASTADTKLAAVRTSARKWSSFNFILVRGSN
jgi:hypothetical protein